jgi:DNA-binding NarL/FixJ family response regulator
VDNSLLEPERKQQLDSLTRGEVEVFVLIATSGLSDKEIARKLGVEQHRTIESRCNKIREKLALDTRNARSASLTMRDILVDLLLAATKSP